MNPIVVVGAGVTGCVIARELAGKGYKVVLLEKDAQVGGLAKTFRYGDSSFDIGPHRFSSSKKQILDFITAILKDNYKIISRQSDVHFLGKYYSWPLRPTALLNLPFTVTLKAIWDLLFMIARNKNNDAESFEDYVLMNYGPSLYNVFFKDYTEKFLNLPPKEVHAEWAREGMKRTIIDERIASHNLSDILKLFLRFNPLNTEFIYPDTGIDAFCNRLEGQIKQAGGEVMLNARITGIRQSYGRITEIFLEQGNIIPETVIWTGPLGAVCGLLDVPCKGIDYLSLLLFNVETNKPLRRSFQWCYYGNREIIFSRVTMPRLFSEKMSPKHTPGLCVEVACRQADEQWKNPRLLIERVKDGLIKVGLIGSPEDIINMHIEKIPDAYPVYTKNYPRDLKEVKKCLSGFSNLILAGRTGLFRYNNMDDSIENALETAESIILRDSGKLK